MLQQQGHHQQWNQISQVSPIGIYLAGTYLPKLSYNWQIRSFFTENCRPKVLYMFLRFYSKFYRVQIQTSKYSSWEKINKIKSINLFTSVQQYWYRTVKVANKIVLVWIESIFFQRVGSGPKNLAVFKILVIIYSISGIFQTNLNPRRIRSQRRHPQVPPPQPQLFTHTHTHTHTHTKHTGILNIFLFI